MTTRSFRPFSVPSLTLGLPLLAVLAACSPSVPDSGAGVGFQDYNSYMRNADAGMPASGNTGAPLNGTGIGYAAPAAAAPAMGFDPAAASAALDRADGSASAAPAAAYPAAAPYPMATPAAPYAAPVAAAPVYAGGAADRPRGDAPMGIRSESGEVAHSNPTISDENDFSAVSSRESIASDAERIARNRAEYVVVQPKDLPQRPGETGPNIVQYALATNHVPGVQMYSRGGLFAKDTAAACAQYASPDLAQQDFLARGGPDRDRKGLDPDGDGFACGWDPRPFRTALQ